MTPTSGTVLKEARARCGMTQNELAERAGVAQSMISAYENDRREPTYSTLVKLLGATGHTIRVQPLDTVAAEASESSTLRELRRKRRQIVSLLERGGAHHPRIFGSVARGDDTAASDIDVMVDLDPEVGIVRLIGLERHLSELLGRPVDLVPTDSLKPNVRDDAMAESVLL